MKAGWTYKNLADLCIFFGDGDWIESKDQSSNGIRLIQTGNVAEGVFKDRGDKARYINEETFDRLRCTEIFEGDCLISRLPDPVGRSAILPDTGERMITAVDCTIVRFNHQLCLPEFFNYYSQSIEYINNVSDRCTGTTRNRISRSQLGNTPIPTPDVGEQRRIVTLLDEAFADIATAKANAEKNLQNAETLFQSQLTTLFNQRAKNATHTTLGKATGGIFTGPFGSLLHKQDYIENGIPLVNPAHISQNGIEPDYRKTVSGETAKRLASYIMRMGDIVIGRRGEMGRCALVTETEDGWLCGTGSFFIKPSSRCDAGYLVHLLRSDQCKQQLEKIAGGAVMPNLSNTDLSNFALELPPVEDQKQIVVEIEEAKESVERLKSIYRQKLTALDDLKKSLLHQAFSGQL